MEVSRYLRWQNHAVGPYTNAACLNHIKLVDAVFTCDAPKMASNLACEGVLAAVGVLRLIKRLSTGPREVVVPENLI